MTPGTTSAASPTAESAVDPEIGTELPTDAASTRGRPRSADRTEAILQATHELCLELGYDGLRMQDVAERAGTGLATIYRRWSTKPELVAASMAYKPFINIETTGDPVEDLRQLIEGMVADVGTGEMIAGFLGAIREHEELRTAFVESVMGDLRPRLRELITAIAPNSPSVDFLADSVPGVIILRATMLDQALDPAAYANEVVDLVLALR